MTKQSQERTEWRLVRVFPAGTDLSAIPPQPMLDEAEGIKSIISVANDNETGTLHAIRGRSVKRVELVGFDQDQLNDELLHVLGVSQIDADMPGKCPSYIRVEN